MLYIFLQFLFAKASREAEEQVEEAIEREQKIQVTRYLVEALTSFLLLQKSWANYQAPKMGGVWHMDPGAADHVPTVGMFIKDNGFLGISYGQH